MSSIKPLKIYGKALKGESKSPKGFKDLPLEIQGMILGKEKRKLISQAQKDDIRSAGYSRFAHYYMDAYTKTITIKPFRNDGTVNINFLNQMVIDRLPHEIINRFIKENHSKIDLNDMANSGYPLLIKKYVNHVNPKGLPFVTVAFIKANSLHAEYVLDLYIKANNLDRRSVRHILSLLSNANVCNRIVGYILRDFQGGGNNPIHSSSSRSSSSRKSSYKLPSDESAGFYSD